MLSNFAFNSQSLELFAVLTWKYASIKPRRGLVYGNTLELGFATQRKNQRFFNLKKLSWYPRGTNWVTSRYHCKNVKKPNARILKKNTPIDAGILLFEIPTCRFHQIRVPSTTIVEITEVLTSLLMHTTNHTKLDLIMFWLQGLCVSTLKVRFPAVSTAYRALKNNYRCWVLTYWL
jgi:hypothetical protein